MVQMIPQEVIEEIRQRTNIVEVVEQYVQLKKSGKNYMGLCPFHEERSPSFSVAEDKQIFHCFGCGKGGTVFNFIQEIDGVSFPEAVRKVAELEHIAVSIDWEQTNAVVSPVNSKQKKLLDIHKKAADLFHHILMNTQMGEAALDYLLERGLTEELIQTFQIGFAPQKRDFLTQIFQKEEETNEILQESGLFIQKENGAFVDRFYQRIMFPIMDERGNCIAFSGRLLKTESFSGEDMPKYLNSPETKLFNKRDVLFNYHRARKEIRQTNTIFLFEGFMDVIAAWQSGIQNGVASMGTSLTNEQIRKLERTAQELVICYDGDTAGVEATNRALSFLTQQSRFQLSVVNIPEKLDPDDYVRKYGKTAFRELALHGRSTPFQFKMMYHRSKKNMNNEKEQLDYIQELLHELSDVHSPLEKDLYLQQLSQDFQLSLHSLEEQLRQIEAEKRYARRQERSQTVNNKQKTLVSQNPITFTREKSEHYKLSQVEKAQRILLYRLMHERHVRSLLSQQADFVFAQDSYQELFLLIDSYQSSRNDFVFADFINYLQEERIKRLAIEIEYQVIPESSSEQELMDVIKIIKNSAIQEKISQKKQQRLEAEKIGNQQLVNQLSIEIVQLVQQWQRMK